MSATYDLHMAVRIAVGRALPKSTEFDGKRVADLVVESLREAGMTVVYAGATGDPTVR